jgi:hypothetical protein
MHPGVRSDHREHDRSDQVHRRPVAMGAGVAFVATLVTWFIAIKIVGGLTVSVSALDLQAATGLVAVIVLLVIMNWFFHKTYWGGWIRACIISAEKLYSLVRMAKAPDNPFSGV